MGRRPARAVLATCLLTGVLYVICGGVLRSESARTILASLHVASAHANASLTLVDPVCFRDKHIVLMGDSTMARAALAFQDMFNCTLVREGSRCDFASYYGDAVNNNTHSKPIPEDAGPFLYGSLNRGCMDCNGCQPRKWYCGVSNFTVEHIGIEFARDVEYPTAYSDFTQESVIRGYMARGTLPYAIVYNHGLHDYRLQDTKAVSASAMYQSNIEWLTSLLNGSFRARGSRLLWISTSAMVTGAPYSKNRSSTANDKIREYNEAAEHVMRKWGVPVFDVFPLTRRPEIKALCLDGIHYGQPLQFYYRFVALNVAMALCRAI